MISIDKLQINFPESDGIVSANFDSGSLCFKEMF